METRTEPRAGNNEEEMGVSMPLIAARYEAGPTRGGTLRITFTRDDPENRARLVSPHLFSKFKNPLKLYFLYWHLIFFLLLVT